MATVISMGLQKGGVGKTTAAATFADVLSNEKKMKVLVIDFDSQGSLTHILTGTSDIANEFGENNIAKAFRENNLAPNIIEIAPNLHLVPASEEINLMGDFIHRDLYEQGIDFRYRVKTLVEQVEDSYDIILFDLQPAIVEMNLAVLIATDQVIIPVEASELGLASLDSFFRTLAIVKDLNENLQIAGIFLNMVDGRRADIAVYKNIIRSTYEAAVLDNEIKRMAIIGRAPGMGFLESKERPQFIKLFMPLVEEVMERVEHNR